MPRRLKGDTLVEMLIAFAIFSAVAVATISISRTNINRIQGSLEDTVAQAEIDAQAEALRFIQESYQASPNNQFYSELWKKILKQSNKVSDVDISNIQEDYASPDKPYDQNNESNIFSYKAFVINSRLLNSENLSDINKIVVSASTDASKFSAASTTPKLVYSGETENLISSTTDSKNLARAEGIWIIAVLGEKGNFVDFYIRTCWSTPGSSTPDKISTIIRLSAPGRIAFLDKSNIIALRDIK